MRIATVLGVVGSYGAVIDALRQHGLSRPVLRDLSATEQENTSQVAPLSFLSAYAYPVDPYAKCYWNSNLMCEMNSLKNDLKLGSTCDVGVPVPSDNYVGDKRVNKYDAGLGATDFPFIEIAASGPKSGLGQPRDATTGMLAWTGYMNNPSKSQDNIRFPAIGLYDMTIHAYDYDRDAECEGCIAVRDTYRPRFKDGSCPFAPSDQLKLNSASISKVSKYETEYDTYVAVSNRLNNAESDATCHDSTSTQKIFYDPTPTPFTGTCFSQDGVKCNVDKLKRNPFSITENIKRPNVELEHSLNDKCSWCCTKSITLKEKYTEYTCPSTSTQPPSTCVGLPGSTCGMETCIKATGNDIAQATIKLNEKVTAESKKILAELEKPSTMDVANTIHYSIPCTSYDETGTNTKCHYIVKLSEVIDIGPKSGGGPKFVTDLPLNSEKASDYVFWRVKSGSHDWATWDPKNDAELTFKASSTTISVEAWTACGQILSFELVIKIYLHRTLTCDQFADMWSPQVAKVYGEDTYCNVPDSDFSLFNLDYDYDAIIPAEVGQEYERLKGTYKDIKCDIRVRESTAPEHSVNAATLIGETSENKINKNFAVELVHDPHTAPKTVFRIECTFSRLSYGSGNGGNGNGNGNGNTPAPVVHPENTITCFHSFTITDCDKPRIDPNVEEEDVCAYDCADNGKPGAFEACGGTIVSSKADQTFVKSSPEETCCTKCDPSLNCITFGPTEIKRCEVPSMYPYSLAAAEPARFASGSTTAMALLGASAMVAVVALVVVKRRGSRTQETGDAYYPLLE